MADDTAAELWAFALDFYARDGIQHACLALQDSAGADVPLLLLLCFAAARGQVFELAEIVHIESEIAPWRIGVIETLRLARRALRSWSDEGSLVLREAVKQAELEAERLQLSRLAGYLVEAPAATAQAPDKVTSAARRSMDAYALLVPAIEGRHLNHMLQSLG